MDSPVNDTITTVPGLLVGHWTDAEAATGCTVLLCPEGAVASADVRGGAPGDVRPAAAPGYAACEAASAAPPAMGSVGAGTGATVAKALGVERALKGGAGRAAERTGEGRGVGG